MPQSFAPNVARRSPLAEAAAALGRPLRLAHRGLHDAPNGGTVITENSLAAFAAVVGAGLDGIECDLRVSSDGETVLVHDADLRRTHGIALDVAATSALTLSAHGIARIDELLAASPTLSLDLELKVPPAPSLFAALRGAQRGPTDGVVFSSFDLGVLAALRDTAPEWSRWLNVEGGTDGVIERARAVGCAGIAVDAALCDRRFISEASTAGLEVAVWTLRSAEDLARLTQVEWSNLVAACVEGAAAVAAE